MRGTLLLLLGLTCASLAHAARDDASFRVAVLAFDDVSEEPGHGSLGLGMQSMLTTDLANVPGLTLVERARLGDVQAELARGRGKAFDAGSVARMGKLLGASHVAVGSFAVVGKNMRLDARLVEVKSAKVVTTAHAEGEKEGFFEHEKTLVKGLVNALAVELPAKVRGELGRYHTTDYEAFQRFSDGLARADLGKFEEARAALQHAVRIDARFSLAQRSLEELEQLAKQVGKREELAKQVESADLKRTLSGEAQRVQAWLASLEKLATKSDADGSLALYAIATVLREQPRALLPYWSRVDRFAEARAGDAWERSYWKRAQREGARYGFNQSVGFGLGSSLGEKDDLTLPGKPQWSYLRQRMATDASSEIAPQESAFDAQAAERFSRQLVDAAAAFSGGQADTLRIAEDALRGILRSGKASKKAREPLLLAFADRYLFAGASEEAARLLSELGSSSESSEMLASVRERLETLHAFEGLLKRHAEDAGAIREWFMTAPWTRSMYEPTFDASGIGYRMTTLERDLGEQGRDGLLCELRSARRMSMDQHVVVGKEPLWLLQGKEHVHTGGRIDPWAARALHYEYSDKAPYPALLAVGALPRAQGSVSAHFQLTPPADFRARDDARCSRGREKSELAKASAGLLLGLRDIFVGQDQDPKTGALSTPRPMRALGARIREGKLELFALVESFRLVIKQEREDQYGDKPGSFAAKAKFEIKPLAEAALPAKSRYELKLEQRGSTLTASAAGVTVSAQIADAQPGFAGVWFEGAGFASVQAVELGQTK